MKPFLYKVRNTTNNVSILASWNLIDRYLAKLSK